eukprot:6197789-Pleurochrysis_carterae.AAC.1
MQSGRAPTLSARWSEGGFTHSARVIHGANSSKPGIWRVRMERRNLFPVDRRTVCKEVAAMSPDTLPSHARRLARPSPPYDHRSQLRRELMRKLHEEYAVWPIVRELPAFPRPRRVWPEPRAQCRSCQHHSHADSPAQYCNRSSRRD